MIMIRLSRNGIKKRPFYKILVTNSKNYSNGKFIEHVGFFNPIKNKKEKNISLNLNRIKYWISKGASVSNRVNILLKNIKKQQII